MGDRVWAAVGALVGLFAARGELARIVEGGERGTGGAIALVVALVVAAGIAVLIGRAWRRIRA